MARTTHSLEHPSDSLYACAAATSHGSTAGFSWDVGSRKSATESGSVLRLNNYMRASMGKSRLSNLALLHIHYDTEVDLDRVVDCFAPRRLQFESVLR